jgi:penicillin-binding protein 2
VLLNVQDGTVLAMVSIPVFDLNTYRQNYDKLQSDDFDFPLMHRAVARAYEPGSTVKPIGALAGLEAGIISPQSTSVCEGKLFPNLNYLKCTSTHGPVQLVEAIALSCNIYFYRLGERLERQQPGRLLDVYRQFGFGGKLGTALPGESAGKLPNSTSPEDARFWAIGQSITVTPLQIANEMATIARRGLFLSPSVLADDTQQVRRKIDISPSHFDAVQKGMHGVTTIGTARGVFREANLNFEVCGKSGTAQTNPQWQDKNGNHRMDSDEILRDGDMVWFAGFAPYKNPQVAFAVIVEYVNYAQEGGGAKVAAPFAVEALKECQARGYIK